jgi:O-acetyl-ADP-ribose deacetylase (regulator of RNase III)
MIVMSGNVLETPNEIIAHQVNCLGTMGAGLAKQIKDKYPQVESWYKIYCHKRYEQKILGTGQIVSQSDHTFFNIFGQYGYGTSKRQTDYEAFKSGFKDAILKYRFMYNDYKSQLKIAIPYHIGCGLAGGDWKIISKILEQLESEENVEFVAYKL